MKLDLICMGRAAVDLYGEQVGARLEDQSSFAKYLGGTAANTAVGASRLGLKVAMLVRVGDEQNGRFVRETLAAEGIDVSHVRTDPARLTALVFLAVKDRQTFPHVFYREDPADMAVAPEDFDEAFLASARAFLVSGTHFSREAIAASAFAALRLAKKAGRKVVFDVDYRPVLWNLTGHARGEERFVASQAVSEKMQQVVPFADLVIGTEEEMRIAGGIDRIRSLAPAATLVLKRGPLGCSVFTPQGSFDSSGRPVEVFNVLGAGDAFAAGFLSGWLRDLPLEECARRANACGALVVSRHGCAPAMPSREELELYLARSDWPFRLRDSVLLNDVHRKTTGRKAWPGVLALAFDHRKQFEELGPPAKISQFKRLVAAALAGASVPGKGAIVDDRYGEEALFALTGSGTWLARPVEVPGSRPLAFEAGANVGVALRAWPAEHVVKCLVHYGNDDLAKLRQIYEACVDTGHELLLELVTQDPPLEEIYAAGIKPDWWKLLPPATEQQWSSIGKTIEKNDRWCRGVLLLGMEASEDALERSFALAARHPVCKGFAVGRSIFMGAAQRWFAGGCSDGDVIEEVKKNYLNLVSLWNAARLECKESVS
jgi:5-dehydro-2-deoxygluconokinase